MPTYSYACTECGHAFDQFQSFTDDALTECPECRGRLRKLFNAVGVVFKGSGFYRTDSRATTGSTSNGEGGSEGSSTSDSAASSGSKEAGSSASSSKSSSSSGSNAGSSSSTASTGS